MMVLYNELFIRTQYDGRDLMSIEEIYYYGIDGEEQICVAATDACIDIATCADQGADLWSWLREQVEERLQQCDITCTRIVFDDDRGN